MLHLSTPKTAVSGEWAPTARTKIPGRRLTPKRRGKAQLLALLAGCWTCLAMTAHGSGTVTNCTEAALRSAVIGGGLVTLACDSVIPLTSPLIIVRDTVVDGTGHTNGLTATGITNLVHMFVVPAGVKFELRGVSISGGSGTGAKGINGGDGETARGAAILIEGGTVRLDGCTVSEHRVKGGDGSNATQPAGQGGDGASGSGGAIYNDGGFLFITNTIFSANSAEGGVGGEGGGGGITGGAIGGPGGDGGGGYGAAIFNTGGGVVSVADSTFSSNTVAGASAGLGGLGSGVLGFPGEPGEPGAASGVAIFNERGTVTIVNSTFNGNSGDGAPGSDGDAGTRFQQPEDGTGGGLALGGGVFNAMGVLALTNCTFVANSIVGGPGGAGGAGDASAFGSDGGKGGHGGAALGGGVYTASAGATLIVNCTFVENSVIGGSGGAGGAGTGLGEAGKSGEPGRGEGAAFFNANGTLTLRNSILAHGAYGLNAAGLISDQGFNLSSDSTPTLGSVGSRNFVEPQFGPLALAGGHSLVMTLSSNSPAINAITVPGGNGGPRFDQRNATRNEPWDIGAYEFGGALASPSLTASARSGAVVLAWPASSDWILQSTRDLKGINSWAAVTNLPTLDGDLQKLSVGKTNAAAFYRLAPR